jgi:CPA1 family monovalent cation:H+ antiporter
VVPDVELLVFLLAAVAMFAALGQRSHVPSPIVLVLGGLVLGLVPGLPAPEIEPDVVLFVFLPPLLYFAAFTASAYELRDDALPITLLAVGLVLVTMVAVAAVAHWVVGLPWAVAFALGAILGPTDPVAATSVLERLGAPARLTAILEGESLVNDGTGLTAYKIAIGAVGTAGVALGWSAVEFVLVASGGIAIGLVAGWVFSRLRSVVEDPAIDVTLSLLTPFAAFVPAEHLGASGVLATVTAGLLIGTRSHGLGAPETRLRTRTFWEALVFLANSLLFLLIGLQLPSIVDRIDEGALPELAGQALLIAAVVMGVRMAWMFVVPGLVAVIAPFRDGARSDMRERIVIGWSGMRGAVSLAAALAVPTMAASGEPFPHRDLVIFLAYAVVLLTLVIPGATLGPLLQRLGLRQAEERRRADAQARARITHAALERLDEMAGEEGLPERVVDRLRERYQARLQRLESHLDDGRPRPRRDDQRHGARLQTAMLEAEREAVADMQRERAYPADLLGRLQGELDLDESRLRARSR